MLRRDDSRVPSGSSSPHGMGLPSGNRASSHVTRPSQQPKPRSPRAVRTDALHGDHRWSLDAQRYLEPSSRASSFQRAASRSPADIGEGADGAAPGARSARRRSPSEQAELTAFGGVLVDRARCAAHSCTRRDRRSRSQAEGPRNRGQIERLIPPAVAFAASQRASDARPTRAALVLEADVELANRPVEAPVGSGAPNRCR